MFIDMFSHVCENQPMTNAIKAISRRTQNQKPCEQELDLLTTPNPLDEWRSPYIMPVTLNKQRGTKDFRMSSFVTADCTAESNFTQKEAKDFWLMFLKCHPKTLRTSFVTADCTAESNFT